MRACNFRLARIGGDCVKRLRRTRPGDDDEFIPAQHPADQEGEQQGRAGQCGTDNQWGLNGVRSGINGVRSGKRLSMGSDPVNGLQTAYRI